jgi:hypothetical protein
VYRLCELQRKRCGSNRSKEGNLNSIIIAERMDSNDISALTFQD